MEDQIIDVILSLLPAIVVAFVAYYFLRSFIDNESRRRSFLLRKDLSNTALPTRLQAYERLTLFMERIKPVSLLVRLNPGTMSKDEYEQLLINSIEQEYEHNISQQVYVSEGCWNTVRAAKNTVIQRIRQTSLSDKVDSADRLREVILSDGMDLASPSSTAQQYIRKEVADII